MKMLSKLTKYLQEVFDEGQPVLFFTSGDGFKQLQEI